MRLRKHVSHSSSWEGMVQEAALRSVPLRMQPYALGLGSLSQVIKTEPIQRAARNLSQEGSRMPLRLLATHFTLDLSNHTEALNPCLARTKQPR